MADRQTLEEQLDDVEASYRRLIVEIEDQMSEMEQRAGELLDRIQGQLPEDAADVMERIREVGRAMRKRLASLSDQALDATKDAVDALADSGRSTASQPAAKKKAVKKSAAKKKTVKKSAAKGSAAKKSAAKKAAATPSAQASAQWTKAELSAEATRLKIAGRSSMSKAELVRAINRAG